MRILLIGFLLVSIALILPAKLVRSALADYVCAVSTSECNQSVAARNDLMSEAERGTFSVRRVEFIGLTYTHDQVVRDRMTPLVQEGDIFSRAKLIKSLQKMSRLRASLYPLRLRDVVVQLDKQDRSVDMIICFKQKPRSQTSAARSAAR
jgi:hypothetical protein